MSEDNKISAGLNLQDFKKLYRDHYANLCYFGQKYIRDREASEDIVHDVFVKLWEKRNTIDNDKSVKSYLFQAVNNRCLNYIRDDKKFNKDYDQVLLFDGNAIESTQIEQEELESKILYTIESLPDRCREVFKLSRIEELKYKEIAEKMGISVKTVEVQMSKALKILRKELKHYLTVLFLVLLNYW